MPLVGDKRGRILTRTFETWDLPILEQWVRAIESDHFMSRYRPRPDALGPGKTPAPLWFVIVVDDMPVGTLWFESGVAPDEAVLGIFLGDKSIFGRGIGRRAIELAMVHLKSVVAVARITLNVRTTNTLAISCYLRCGFKTVQTSERKIADGSRLRYHTMTRDLRDCEPK
jgi:RimJ/RimL family protein N-acetyltransferase